MSIRRWLSNELLKKKLKKLPPKMRCNNRFFTHRINLHHQHAFSTLQSYLPFTSLHFPSSICNPKTIKLHLANLLQLPSQNHPISLSKQIHANISVWGLQSDSFITNLLIKRYWKAGFFDEARQVFDRMSERNLISWSSMVSMYTQYRFYEEALWVFIKFKKCCNQSPQYMLASLIRSCAKLGESLIGEQVHGHVVKGGFDQDVYVGSSLVDFYAKIADIDAASLVFDGLLIKNAVTWTAILKGYLKCGRSEEALWLFYQMGENNVVSDRYVLSSVLSACSALLFVEGGKQVHGHLLRKEILLDVSMYNVLIDFYTKCGKIQKAESVFDSMVERNVISWTSMIAGYMQNSLHEEAMNLFINMHRLGWNPDEFACTSVLTSCGTLEALKQGRQVHAYSIKANLEQDTFLQNGLIDMYAKCNYMNDARLVFDLMVDHNVVSYNAIIEGYSRMENLYNAVNLFHEMRLRMFVPSLLTFVSLLGVSAALSAIQLSKQIHALIIKFGMLLEIFAGSALIDVYSKCSCLTDARLLFDEMTVKDTVVWNVILFSYTQQLENEEAFKIYSQLQLSEQKPNDFTFVALLTAVSNLSSLQLGRQLHSHLIKIGLDLDPFITSSLIDMYSKCGSLGDACEIFASATFRDASCWNSMITTYAHHGEAKKALHMFGNMLEEGIKPNYISFISLLSACSHAGLLAKGLHHFELMPKFGIEPGTEHYACIVNLLGRAGKLYEAKEFIEKMPIKPSAAIWRSLLSACRMSGNIDLGKYAAEQAISIEASDSGSYALLSNIYAAKGMWQNVKEVREKLDVNGVVKEPGCSWIEVSNEVHVFIARDRSHLKTEHIFSVLDDLVLQIRDSVYGPGIPTLLVNQ